MKILQNHRHNTVALHRTPRDYPYVLVIFEEMSTCRRVAVVVPPLPCFDKLLFEIDACVLDLVTGTHWMHVYEQASPTNTDPQAADHYVVSEVVMLRNRGCRPGRCEEDLMPVPELYGELTPEADDEDDWY